MSATRGVAVLLVLLAVILVGPLSPWALAQAVPQLPEPTVVGDGASEEIRVTRRTDAYDIAAGVATAARAPLNAATCIFGGAVATVIFVLTFGSAYKASARVVEEGCAQKWVVRGDDLRPRGTPSVIEEQMRSYGQERR
jgi:hypothetical protein